MFPKSIRIWHWLNAIAILGIAVTVFLREFWMNRNSMAITIMSKLNEANITVSEDQAMVAAKAIRSPMWEWHIYLGFFVGALILYRLYLAAKKIKIDDGRSDQKMKMVRLSHYAIIGLITLAVISGAIGTYGDDIGLVAKETAKGIKNMHELISWVIVAFIPLHIVGVFVSDNSDYKGIVSKIISG